MTCVSPASLLCSRNVTLALPLVMRSVYESSANSTHDRASLCCRGAGALSGDVWILSCADESPTGNSVMRMCSQPIGAAQPESVGRDDPKSNALH